MRRLLSIFAVAITASSAFASLSAIYQQFPEGPAKWLMTRDEQRAWSRVSNDADAQKFIDLFWARRDPTPGTPRNEFKEQFEQRVALADKSFKTGLKRGSLTDVGRVYLLLGPPVEFNSQEGQTLSGNMLIDNGTDNPNNPGRNPTSSDPSLQGALTQRGARKTFTYKNQFAIGLNAPIVFIENLRSHDFELDPQQSNVTGALQRAQQKLVVNQLDSVPEWATSEATEKFYSKTKIVAVDKSSPATAQLPKGENGAHHFVLVKDVQNMIDPNTGRDPFGGVTAASSFTNNDELGYAFEFCGGPEADDADLSLHLAIAITGEQTDGRKVQMKAPADDVQGEHIKGMAGCYVVRGSLPASDIKAGKYHFAATVEDPKSKQTYELAQDFLVE